MTASSSTDSGHSTELRKLIALRGAWEFLLLQPIAIPFFISNGLTTSEIFWLQSVYFITLCLSDIPSGLMGVRFGERRILLAACIIKGIGGMLLCLPSKSLIFIAYAIIGVANALYLAVESTLVFSNLPTHRARLQVVEKVQSLSQGIIFAAILLSGLAGSLVAQKYGLRVLIFANALFAWLSLGLSASLKKTELRASTTVDAGHYKDVLRLLTLPSNVTPLVLIAFGFTVTAVVPIYIQNRLVDEKVQLLSFGLVFIFQQSLAMLLGFATARSNLLRMQIGKISTIFMCLLWMGAFLLLHFAPAPSITIALVLIELARIALLLNVTSKFQNEVPDEWRTTVMAILNFVTRLCGAAVLGLIGSLSQDAGSIFLLLSLLILLAMTKICRLGCRRK